MTRTTEGPAASAGLPRRLPSWLPPALALGLAGSSVAIGAVGYERVTAEPDAAIGFIVDDDLPHGITQESMEAAAEDRAISYEPFTVHVVERELEWDEYTHGEIDGADMMLSVGDDRDDPDLVLADATRVAFTDADADDRHSVASTVRETFGNNRTIGHGPNAVVGAALTAADLRFDPGGRSPVVWVSGAALPLLVGVAIMFLWVRSRGHLRRRLQRFSQARLRLARVVLELDVLELRFETARAALGRTPEDDADDALTPLESGWSRIRRDSLRLARDEQVLEHAWLNGPAPRASTGDGSAGAGSGTTHPQTPDVLLGHFEKGTAELQRQADALAAASELRAGHAGSGSVLDRLALPLLQSVDAVLAQGTRLAAVAGPGVPEMTAQLEEHRAQLLSLSQEAAAVAREDAADDDTEDHSAERQASRMVARHADLLDRWQEVEQQIVGTCSALSTAAVRDPSQDTHEGRSVLHRTVQDRVRDRIRTSTAGAEESLAELRASLGLGHGAQDGPMFSAERVLTVLDHAESTGTPGDRGISTEGWQTMVATAGILAPLAAGLISGWVAVEQSDAPTAYGRTLVGDQPLADLRVVGDPDALPELHDAGEDDPPNAETLDLELIREHMARNAEYGEDRALLPDHLELTVALLPADDYVDHRPRPDDDHRIEIDYWSLIEAQELLKEEIGAQDPEVLDPSTGEVRLGQGILPVWLLDEESYAVGYPLTGEFSSGVDSRLGTYHFAATEPLITGRGDFEIPLGTQVGFALHDLGRAMEYNHQESVKVDTTAVFWLVAVTGWTGAQTLLMIGVAAAEAGRRRFGTRAVRRQLAGLRSRLDDLALGLDLSRMDMVAVLGADSATEGRAEQADQRLHEAGLVTAWREVQTLERLPRREQRGEDWESRVIHVEKLIDTLTAREADVAARAEELLRTQRQN